MRSVALAVMPALLIGGWGCTGKSAGLQPIGGEAASSSAIESGIQAQAAAWNAGDIDGFMSMYWNSPQMTFSAGGQTHRGWQTTRDRYKKRYDSREKMGRLTFTELETSLLADDAAFVLGRWRLERAAPLQGNFTLLLRKFDGAWKIVHDHSSSTGP